MQIPSGIAVKEGTTLCFTSPFFPTGGAGVTVNGFIAKDK
jgi:hypothetical protein